jgi:hypothetical protein
LSENRTRFSGTRSKNPRQAALAGESLGPVSFARIDEDSPSSCTRGPLDALETVRVAASPGRTGDFPIQSQRNAPNSSQRQRAGAEDAGGDRSPHEEE